MEFVSESIDYGHAILVCQLGRVVLCFTVTSYFLLPGQMTPGKCRIVPTCKYYKSILQGFSHHTCCSLKFKYFVCLSDCNNKFGTQFVSSSSVLSAAAPGFWRLGVEAPDSEVSGCSDIFGNFFRKKPIKMKKKQSPPSFADEAEISFKKLTKFCGFEKRF